MAKPTTKKAKAPSLHSRAARRATSPSINTDKSLKKARPPPESLNNRPSVLGLYQNAGVTKKAKRGRKAVMSARARRRYDRGLERAEEIVDRTARKVEKSKRSALGIQRRRKAWDEINANTTGAKTRGNKFAGLHEDDGEDVEGEGKGEELHDEMEEAGDGGVQASDPTAVPGLALLPQDDDDEIL